MQLPDPPESDSAPTDAELIVAISDGNRPALNALHERYAGYVLAVAFSILRSRPDAEDVLQDVFVAVLRRASTYRPDKAGVKSWLFTIARNRALDAVRRRQAKPGTDIDTRLVVDVEARLPEDQLGDAERELAVRRCLDKLPSDQRDVIVLTRFEGMNQFEAAEQLGVPIGTVKSRTRLALAKLARCLGYLE